MVSARRRARIGWRAPGRIAASPSVAAPAEQVEQHRLGLVVGGVAGGGVRRQGAEPGRRGPSPRDWDRQRPSTRWTTTSTPRAAATSLTTSTSWSRVLAQAVVDVMGDDAAVGGHRQHQQGEGVGTAGHRAGKRCPRVGKRAPPDQPGAAPWARSRSERRHPGSIGRPRTRDTQSPAPGSPPHSAGSPDLPRRAEGAPDRRCVRSPARTARRRRTGAASPRARSAAGRTS